MAEYFRKAFESNRRATRSDINSTGMSLNKNGEFRIPTVPSRCATQTLYSSALSNQNTEPSALECLKPIGDKFEVIDKLQIIPIEEVKQISAEFMQRLDSLCMEKITRQLLPTNPNPAPSIVDSKAPYSRSTQPDDSVSIVKNISVSKKKKTVANNRNESKAPYSRSRKPENSVPSVKSIAKPKTRTTANKRKEYIDSPVKPQRRRITKPTWKQQDDFNITKNSLRNTSINIPTMKSRKKTTNIVIKRKKTEEKKVNRPPNATLECSENANEERNIENKRIDRELLGDVSSIIGGSWFQCSPNNVLKNVEKISCHETAENDQSSQHLFSPFSSNPRSTSGVISISTPLPNTSNKRSKESGIVAVLKGLRARPAKRVLKNDILSLDTTQGSEFCTSDFSDVE